VSINIQEINRPELSQTVVEKRDFISGKILKTLNAEIHFFGNKLSDKKKEGFYSELCALLSAGMDIKSALEIIVEEQKKEKDKRLFNELLENLLNGSTLSEAIEMKQEFTAYEFHSIRIGEESGRINDVLNELATYYNKRLKQRKQITEALTYPVLVLLTAVGAVLFMMNFIVPMFMDVFQRFGGDLPAITQFIVNISSTISGNFGVFILGLVGMIFVYFMVRRQEWYKKIVSPLILRLPVIGNMINKIYLVRFCQSMSLLISSKTPLINAVRLVREIIRFYPYQQALLQVEDNLMEGGLLHQSLSDFKIFDKRIVSLVKVGEEINKLDEIFEKLNKQYNEELEHQIGILSNLLEPVMILFVGLLVAVILISMYLPLFQMSTSFY
jgi:type IV pilus assembly protein PilC